MGQAKNNTVNSVTTTNCRAAKTGVISMDNEYSEPSVCDDCDIGDGWECQFCCNKCYEDYGECPNPDCDPMDI